MGAWVYGACAWVHGCMCMGAWVHVYGAWCVVQVHGAWVHGAWVHGVWCMGAWCMGAWCMGAWVHGAWVHGVWCMVHGAWCMVHGGPLHDGLAFLLVQGIMVFDDPTIFPVAYGCDEI